MKVLSKRSSASSTEHLWSKFKNIWSTARASLGPTKATKLVMLGTNLFIERHAAQVAQDKNHIAWHADRDDDDGDLADPEASDDDPDLD